MLTTPPPHKFLSKFTGVSSVGDLTRNFLRGRVQKRRSVDERPQRGPGQNPVGPGNEAPKARETCWIFDWTVRYSRRTSQNPHSSEYSNTLKNSSHDRRDMHQCRTVFSAWEWVTCISKWLHYLWFLLPLYSRGREPIFTQNTSNDRVLPTDMFSRVAKTNINIHYCHNAARFSTESKLMYVLAP